LRFDEKEYNKKIPLGRMANIDDIIGPILFLLSDNARYITGQVIHVNGGGFMRD
jgi:NAD(P)-dependent dehydrogenase (short-subunit alcohol dehydrogenase family)